MRYDGNDEGLTGPPDPAATPMTQPSRPRCSLLVVDDEPYILTALAAFLHGEVNADLELRVEERTRALQEAYQELEQKNKMLEKLALTDPLTNLPNRRAMDRLAERELRRRDRYPGPLSILLIDVDHFKSINERYLLPGGDKVLTDLARTLTGSIRGGVDSLGRIGGEEF